MRAKARLTITLPTELLDEVDRIIDRQTVRNRSHAIVQLLLKSLSPIVSTAVPLAGGKSEDEYTSALLPIHGQALIAHSISHLMARRIRRSIILAGHNETLLPDWGSGSGY